MTFHRTPAEMADDVSFARSPVGCSTSRHLLWLTAEDLEQVGPEPIRTQVRVDFDDPSSVAAEREHSRLWKIWWGDACDLSEKRRREAMSDPVWVTEYMRLIRLRREAGPAELEEIRRRSQAFEAANPERGLTPEEDAVSGANWEKRWEVCREINRLRRNAAIDHKGSSRRRPRGRVTETPADTPRVIELLAELKLRDRRNDAWVSLRRSRPTLGEHVDALRRVHELNPDLPRADDAVTDAVAV